MPNKLLITYRDCLRTDCSFGNGSLMEPAARRGVISILENRWGWGAVQRHKAKINRILDRTRAVAYAARAR